MRVGQSMYGAKRLEFRSEAEQRAYYESKYHSGGYDNGVVTSGVNISEIYHAERRRVAKELLAAEDGDTILDAGCGSGELAAQLAEYCKAVHAVDIAANALSPKFKAVRNLHFQQGSIQQLNLTDECVDKIVCMETLEHVREPTRSLDELHRILRRGGRLVLTYPTINRTFVRLCRLSPRLEISEHLNEWSYGELVAEASARGLRLERSEGIAFDLGPLALLKRINRRFALGITNLSLKIRQWPSNSLFVVLSFRK